MNAIRIEAEDYKLGTNGIEYNDTSTVNLGGEYRPNEPVDIQVTQDVGGGFNVGWIKSGEWLTYDLDIPVAGTYDLVFRVASKKANSSFTITIGGQSYTQTFGNTGGNQSWQDVVISGVNLSAGIQELRMDMNSRGFNFNYFELIPVDPSANTPPTSSGIANITVNEGADNTVISLFDAFADAQDADSDLTYQVVNNTNPALFETVPVIDPITGNLTLDYSATGTGTSDITIRVTDTQGLFAEETFSVTVSNTPTSGNGIRIEAEDYKAGTNGVEYNDTTNDNLGGAYRPNEPVDIQVTQDDGGGFNIGWITSGEWLTYDIHVPNAGT